MGFPIRQLWSLYIDVFLVEYFFLCRRKQHLYYVLSSLGANYKGTLLYIHSYIMNDTLGLKCIAMYSTDPFRDLELMVFFLAGANNTCKWRWYLQCIKEKLNRANNKNTMGCELFCSMNIVQTAIFMTDRWESVLLDRTTAFLLSATEMKTGPCFR